jgi:hypothetical protein
MLIIISDSGKIFSAKLPEGCYNNVNGLLQSDYFLKGFDLTAKNSLGGFSVARNDIYFRILIPD